MFVETYGDEDNKDKEEPDSFQSQAKKVLGVSKKLWTMMPLLLSNVKLGNHKIIEPTMFYVKEFDDDSVTLTNVPKDGQPDDESDYDDPDDEIDLDKSTITGRIEVTISKDDFDGLQKPQTFQGMDTMSLRIGGGGGMM